jgi:hypothetical protein
MSSIALMSFECPPADFSKVSFANKKKYCNIHNYDFLCFKDKLSSRPASWIKILYLQKFLEKYDWILWTDADSYVIDGDRRIEEFVDPSKDLVVCEDDVGINFGVFLIKSSDWSHWLLSEIWDFKKYGNNVLGTTTHFVPRTGKVATYNTWEQTNVHSIVGLHGENFTENIMCLPEKGDHFNVRPDLATDKSYIVHHKGGWRKYRAFFDLIL